MFSYLPHSVHLFLFSLSLSCVFFSPFHYELSCWFFFVCVIFLYISETLFFLISFIFRPEWKRIECGLSNNDEANAWRQRTTIRVIQEMGFSQTSLIYKTVENNYVLLHTIILFFSRLSLSFHSPSIFVYSFPLPEIMKAITSRFDTITTFQLRYCKSLSDFRSKSSREFTTHTQ